MIQVTAPAQQKAAIEFKRMFSSYQRHHDLISVGAYVPGSDAVVDKAITMYPQLETYLRQDQHECARFDSSCAHLSQLFPVSL